MSKINVIWLFAKFIPVEGEIKEGDSAIDSNIHHPNNIVKITFDKYKTASDGRGVYSTEGLKKLKKVKLFLCSRDIQVSDEVSCLTDSGELLDRIIVRDAATMQNSEHLWQVMPHMDEPVGGHYWAKDKTFKVIGEISPDATWVKEGDEFEENEISFRSYYTYDNNGSGSCAGFAKLGESIFVDGTGVITSINKVEAYIKCPTCKNLH